MIKIIPDLRAKINSPRVFCMEMNIAEIARFLIDNDDDFFDLPEISIKEKEIAETINWKIATVQVDVVFSEYKRWNPFSSVISHYERIDEKTFALRYNPKIFPFIDDSEMIGNAVHETGHHFGYHHAFKWNPKRKYSGVYLIGYLYAYISREMYKAPLKELNDMKDQLIEGWKTHITKEIK